MTLNLNFRLYKDQLLVYEQDVEGPLEIGRQGIDEPPPYSWLNSKLIIATKDENEIGRRLFRFEPVSSATVTFLNQSRLPVTLPDGRTVASQKDCQVRLPLLLNLDPRGKWAIRLQANQVNDNFSALPHATVPPRPPDQSLRLTSLARLSDFGINPSEILTWLDGVLTVLEAAADSNDFFAQAAKAVVEMVELDSAQVLLLDDGEAWKRCADYSAVGGPIRPASRGVLARVLEEKRTFLRVIEPAGDGQVSLVGVQAVVAAPILDRAGNVFGALYGERIQMRPSAVRPAISNVEARLVEVVAKGVAAGLARLDQERAAMAARVQFEQFFTPELARYLASHPEELLQARSAQVTVLFCDVRGFSRLSEHREPKETLEWLQDVLEAMSKCVLDEGGVVVDYVGDAVMALWGAPERQDDHAARGCRAALKMLASLPELNRKWQETLGEAIELSIGLNTGPAQVGNTGSRCKFKYGALGNTVNLASRVQGVTRLLQCPLLLTAATASDLDDSFRTRKLARVRVKNIETAVEIHELLPADCPDWPEVRDQYQSALARFESREFAKAARALGDWRGKHQQDGPTLVLLYRAVRCMVEGAAADHPVWTMTEK